VAEGFGKDTLRIRLAGRVLSVAAR
jgi:hypothetical protein